MAMGTWLFVLSVDTVQVKVSDGKLRGYGVCCVVPGGQQVGPRGFMAAWGERYEEKSILLHAVTGVGHSPEKVETKVGRFQSPLTFLLSKRNFNVPFWRPADRHFVLELKIVGG